MTLEKVHSSHVTVWSSATLALAAICMSLGARPAVGALAIRHHLANVHQASSVSAFLEVEGTDIQRLLGASADRRIERADLAELVSEPRGLQPRLGAVADSPHQALLQLRRKTPPSSSGDPPWRALLL